MSVSTSKWTKTKDRGRKIIRSIMPIRLNINATCRTFGLLINFAKRVLYVAAPTVAKMASTPPAAFSLKNWSSSDWDEFELEFWGWGTDEVLMRDMAIAQNESVAAQKCTFQVRIPLINLKHYFDGQNRTPRNFRIFQIFLKVLKLSKKSKNQ